MKRISLTAWFADEKDTQVKAAHGVVGHLTEEQYKKAQEWIYRMGEWTDENWRVNGDIENNNQR